MSLKSFPSEIITFLLVLVITGAGLLFYSTTKFKEAGPLQDAVYFTIEKGANMDGIASNLLEEGIIHSKLVFQIGTYLANKQNQLNYGFFEIPPKASMGDVLTIITTPGPNLYKYTIKLILSGRGNSIQLRERAPVTGNYTEIYSENYDGEMSPVIQSILEGNFPFLLSVTIIEGLTSWQIVNSLKNAPFFVGNIDAIPSEGSLAPNTYLIKHSTDRKEFLNRLASNQARILEEEWNNRPVDSHLKSPSEVLILASIIEKETGLVEEKPLVSSVFSNRLDQRMLLQTDPTLIYGLTEGKGYLGRGLRQSELKKDTPYNTYLHPGLPPTPISNPSRLSIHAALHPEDTDYLFFVANGKGGHAFANNYSEHRKNVRAWRAMNN
ncbi:MAG: endolytic transglycosylase MltG [Rhodobacteraceae bacterium]|nr:endolytic transglycosylase MltG [Paracoccaceae bacterium]